MALPQPARAACGQKQPCCSASAVSSHHTAHTRPRLRAICTASASGESTAGKLPVVDDAISLPPPATGSQYAWRRSWGGFSAAGGGGNGGSGRSWQARTRDWGRGPNSSILFIILYRMRLLLLYGVWVTVLYGAFRAIMDVTTAAGKAGYCFVSRAADLVYGSSPDSCSGDGSEPETAAAATVAAATAAAVDAPTGPDMDMDKPAVGLSSSTADQQAAPPSDNVISSSSSSGFPGLKHRPTAAVFNNLMSAVIPLYLMLLGSVVFFASM